MAAQTWTLGRPRIALSTYVWWSAGSTSGLPVRGLAPAFINPNDLRPGFVDYIMPGFRFITNQLHFDFNGVTTTSATTGSSVGMNPQFLTSGLLTIEDIEFDLSQFMRLSGGSFSGLSSADDTAFRAKVAQLYNLFTANNNRLWRITLSDGLSTETVVTTGGVKVDAKLTGGHLNIRPRIATRGVGIAATLSGGNLAPKVQIATGGAKVAVDLQGGAPNIIVGFATTTTWVDIFLTGGPAPSVKSETRTGGVRFTATPKGGALNPNPEISTGGATVAAAFTQGVPGIRVSTSTGGVAVRGHFTFFTPTIRVVTTTGGARFVVRMGELFAPYTAFYTLDSRTGLRINEIRTRRGDALQQRLLDRMFVEQGTRSLRPLYGTLPANGDTLPEQAGDSIRASFLSDEKVESVQWRIDGRRMIFDIQAEVEAVIAV